WRARHDLLALGLGDAAGDGDHRFFAFGLQQPADVRIDLLRGLLADVAGVEHDELGFLAVGRGAQALLGQQLSHALAVVDVQLAAEALDPEGLWSAGLSHGAGPIRHLPGQLKAQGSGDRALRRGGHRLAVGEGGTGKRLEETYRELDGIAARQDAAYVDQT